MFLEVSATLVEVFVSSLVLVVLPRLIASLVLIVVLPRFERLKIALKLSLVLFVFSVPAYVLLSAGLWLALLFLVPL